MENEIKRQLQIKGADIIRVVDISGLPAQLTRGFNKAVIFCMALSKKFILDIYNNVPTDNDDYLEKEEQVEDLADWLAEYFRQEGCQSYAQSEKNNLRHGYVESCYIEPTIQTGLSPLPQKTIAQLAGLGFIGKSNLLVTKDYGSGFSMCSVLTDAPIATEKYPLINDKCGDCEICKNICPGQAIQGQKWRPSGVREHLVDVSKCCCPLKCMVYCPWTLKYANSK